MHQDLDLRSVEAFVEVASAGSFTAAARNLRLTQPSISARIASLETSLGTKLLDRDAGGVATTPAGEVFLPHARGLLRSRGAATRAVRSFLEGEHGTLYVGASSVPGTYLLPAALVNVRERHPGIRVRLRVGDSDSTLAALRHGEMEIGVVGRAVRVKDVTARRVGTDELVLVGAPGLVASLTTGSGKSPSSRAAPPKRIALSEGAFGVLPLVLREEGSATRRVALEATAKLGISARDLDVVLEVDSSSAAIQASLAGLGATFITRLAVDEHIANGRLVQLHVERLDLERPLVLVRRRGRTLSPAASELARALQRNARRDR